MTLVRRKTRGYAMGFATDSHGGQSANFDLFVTCVLWLRSKTPRPVLFCHAGDLTVGNLDDVIANHYEEAWIAADVGYPWEDWVELFAVGNHDTMIPIAAGSGADTPASPFAFLLAEYPALFQGREYYHYDHESTRVIVMNNISDYLDGNGNSAYDNCNPPGTDDEVNPDYSGITTPGSAQRVWLNNVSSSSHLWKIGMCHRALWVPFDSDPRKMNKDARPALKTPIENGMSLLFQGDVHVGSFSGPWYPDPADLTEAYATPVSPGEVGAYSLSLSGGFAGREVDVSTIPGYTAGDVTDAANSTTVHWASGTGVGEAKAQAAYLRFEGDQAYLEIFEATRVDEEGSVVFQTTLLRNPGM